jgi:hypothetical protein
MKKVESSQIEFMVSHWGKLIQDWEQIGHNAIVLTGPIMGRENPEFGRVVQVRKGSGAFGSDTVILRCSDGSLSSHHNQGFFTIAPEHSKIYSDAMKKVDDLEMDQMGATYSIQGNNPASGFVVNGLDDVQGERYSLAITVQNSNIT